MPFNGSGVWTRLYNWANDAANNIKISSTRMDAEMNDMCANGLGNALTRDGQGQPTTNLPMANHKHTGAAAASASGQYLVYGQTSAQLAGLTDTGHPTFEGVTSTGATGTGNLVFSSAPIIANPTFTGAVTLPTLASLTVSGNSSLSTATLSGALTYGGVALTNAVTGTGKMVLATAPTIQTSLNVSGPLTTTATIQANNDGTNAYCAIGSASTIAAFVQAKTSAGGAAAINMFAGASFHSSFATDGSFVCGSGTGAGAGVIAATGNVISSYSDMRLKTDLGRITGALEKILSLRGFYYEANDLGVSHGCDKTRQVGVSAQDVNRVLPEAIRPAPMDHQYMTVMYERLMPLVIEAIRELAHK